MKNILPAHHSTGNTLRNSLFELASFAVVAFLVATASGCNSRVYLGEIGDGGSNILWSATFEAGNLLEWSSDGNGGVNMENVPVGPSVVSEPVRRGRFAARVTTSPPLGMVSSNYLFREAPSPPEAYYSAWFYVSPDFTVGYWLSLIHFRSSDTGDGRNPYATWDMNMNTRPTDGALIPKLYNFVTQTNYDQALPAVAFPVARWVHLEVFLKKASDQTGRIALWMDDVLLREVNNISTGSSSWVQWSIGVSSSNIAPVPGTVYVDDAAISLTRLGPTGL